MDGIEREFHGSGTVEQWDAEGIEAGDREVAKGAREALDRIAASRAGEMETDRPINAKAC